MDHTVPHNGPLSGMIITAATAVLTFSAIVIVPEVYARFDTPMGSAIPMLFLVGAVLMAVHKLESFVAREYDFCPVYHTQGIAWGGAPRRAIFLAFVTTFLGMLFALWLALVGPPWQLALVAVWIAQGLHEVHHAAKSISRRRVYPGLFTSIAFVVLQWGILYPRWFDLVVGERGTVYAWSYLMIPVALAAFILEDRRWIARAPRSAWDPHSGAPQVAFDDGRGKSVS